MHNRDLARLLVKIAGMVIIVSALANLPDAFLRVWPRSEGMTLIALVGLTLAPVSVSILAGLAMFYGAGSIADHALVHASPGDKVEPAVFSGFEEIALTVLGIYIVTAGLAEGFYYWGKWDFYNHYVAGKLGPNPRMLPTEAGGFFAAGTRVFVGALLVFGSRGFIRLKDRILGLRSMRSVVNPPSNHS